MRKTPLTIVLFAVLSGITACGFTPFMYRPDLAQGNIFDENQVARIKPGMSREHVHLILGTPAIRDPFHPDSERYLYRYQSGDSGRIYQRSLSIDYANDVVIGKHMTPIEIK